MLPEQAAAMSEALEGSVVPLARRKIDAFLWILG